MQCQAARGERSGSHSVARNGDLYRVRGLQSTGTAVTVAAARTWPPITTDNTRLTVHVSVVTAWERGAAMAPLEMRRRTTVSSSTLEDALATIAAIEMELVGEE